jgi:putative transposase
MSKKPKEDKSYLRGFSTKLDLNDKQVSAMLGHAGARRWTYNWALELIIKNLRLHIGVPTAIDFHKILNHTVKPHYGWFYEYSKWAPQQALRDLETAMQRFWKLHHENKHLPMNKRYKKSALKKLKTGKLKFLSLEHELGFPNFKKRGHNDSFYLEGGPIIKFSQSSVSGKLNRIKLPTVGLVKTFEKLPNVVDVKNVHISRVADDWFISFKYRPTKTRWHEPTGREVGIDVGLKTHLTLSDGTNRQSPKAYKNAKENLIKLQKSYSKKDKGSKNQGKAHKKLAKAHQRVANVRLDHTHKLTSDLVKSHDRIVIEDLNLRGMMKNHKIASAIADGGLFEFKRQLLYKGADAGIVITLADRFFASTKTCSDCLYKVDEMPLNQRIFFCPCCGMVRDRDDNAAINLENYDLIMFRRSKGMVNNYLVGSSLAVSVGVSKVQPDFLVVGDEMLERERSTKITTSVNLSD